MTIFVICVGSSLLSKATDVTFTRENYYKFRLQYKNSKSKTLSLMCLEILLSKHNT